jgi:hypothetical protein
MLPLPASEPGGSLDDLRALLNLDDLDQFALIVGFLSAALYPGQPQPALVTNGEQGSGKTTVSRVLKTLLDPSAAPVRCEAKEVRDLMIAARNNHVLALDHLSHLKVWLSDALCRLATGGGFSTRELYSNDGEVIFDARRPTILNGIEDFVTRGDLLERAILLRLPAIPEEKRVPESEFWARFHALHPKALGALLDRVSGGLRELPGVTLARLPRMADFARWGGWRASGVRANRRGSSPRTPPTSGGRTSRRWSRRPWPGRWWRSWSGGTSGRARPPNCSRRSPRTPPTRSRGTGRRRRTR